MPQLKVTAIKNYAVTRDVILENLVSRKTYQVFDDSDVTWNNDFDFMKIGEKYDCKVALFGDIDEHKGRKFQLGKLITVGETDWYEALDETGMTFYVASEEVPAGTTQICYDASRYDLIEVNGVAHSGLCEGGALLDD